MKEGLGVAAIKRIGANLRRAWRAFPEAEFFRSASEGLDHLELKQRVLHVIAVLAECLPSEFESAVDVLVKAGRRWDAGETNDPLSGFAAWPVIDFVGEYGLEYPDLSLDALRELTPLFSAEFAIRPFLTHHGQQTLTTLDGWVGDPDPHVRRLISEGTRPRLPWGKQLTQFVDDPRPVLKLLEQLKDDESEYIRRSVANNLNDISKDHPDLVIKTCQRWQRKASQERNGIIRHATRTLVKAKHPGVWGLLGYADPPEVRIKNFRLHDGTVRLGDDLLFELTLYSESDQSQRLVVDYTIHHVKANGQTSPKVFKLKTLTLKPGAPCDLKKRHPFRHITTRRYYAGQHSVEIVINGRSLGKQTFELTGV